MQGEKKSEKCITTLEPPILPRETGTADPVSDYFDVMSVSTLANKVWQLVNYDPANKVWREGVDCGVSNRLADQARETFHRHFCFTVFPSLGNTDGCNEFADGP